MANYRNKKKNRKRTILQVLGGLVILAALMLVAGIGLFIYYAAHAPAFNESSLRDQLPTKIYDKNNNLVTTLYTGQKREEVKFADIPDQMRDAVLATEDNRFYEHGALDYKRLTGAIFKNVTGGFGSQGASTLTQQVIKRSFLTDKKSIERKAQEAYLSYRLEQEYSKNEIFEMYMNKIYYSDGIYGVKTAANYYFGKDLKDLSLAESAYLAGLPQVPNTYNIYDHPEAAEKRKDTVLYLMNRHGRITKAQMEKAQNEDLTKNLVQRTAAQRQNIEQNDDTYAAYVNVIKSEIKKNKEFKGKSMSDILSSGLKIYTNMDVNAQKTLVSSVNNFAGYKNKDQEAAATILDTQTGGLVAISGGRNYQDVIDRNLATDAHAVGSTIKPILSYGPVIENLQWATDHKLQDESEYVIDGTTFRNYDTSSHGIVSMREALRKSYNIPALKTFQSVQQADSSASYDFAKKLGLNYPSKTLGPAEALGGGASEFSTAQMAAAFSAFGNNGDYNEMNAIRKIVTQDDETIKFSHESHQAMKDYTAFMTTNMMKDVFSATGTAPEAAITGLNMAGKTGTATYADETYTQYNLPDNAAKDVWVNGFTPQYSMSVWMGFNKVAEGGANSFNGHIEQAMPQTLLHSVMQSISPIDGKDFTRPSSVTQEGTEYRVTNAPTDTTTTSSPTTEAARESNSRAASAARDALNKATQSERTIENATTEQSTTERSTTERTTTERVTTEAATTESSQSASEQAAKSLEEASAKAAADLKAASDKAAADLKAAAEKAAQNQ